jgi:quercetin dioxygenase-like cupin family protein
MAQQTADHCTNPSEEVIRVGHLTVHFLVTGENSSGTVAVFEVVIPAGQRLMAPAHSHDHYEETVYGIDGVLTWTGGRQADRGWAGAGALHSAGCRSPIRQQRYRRREGALLGYTRRNRSAVFPRVF